MERLICVLVLRLCLEAAYSVYAAQQRFFHFAYTLTITPLPIDTQKVQFCLSYPTRHLYQAINNKGINSTYLIDITRKPGYENTILFASIDLKGDD